MDSRIPRLRRKLTRIPWTPGRSHSFGEERHEFRLGPRLPKARADAFEAEHGVELPRPYRDFLAHMGGSGASPYYGLIPLENCTLFTMNVKDGGQDGRGFRRAHRPTSRGDLFLHIIERGCSDLVLVSVSGPLTGRVLIGNADGFWGPNVSSAPDFLAWYERWLDHMAAGQDNRALELTSPRLRTHPDRHRLAPKI
ncbi:SMI1/KNR4 family protein [Kitasatospora sp. NBC_00240]|uniref:SMI1/KNR4 family protein n=1 Tax=Kitasatospora sp. NBC_00240 TaxID=2903567 RepID=UPI00225BBA54|nr:SMI1/KNR4 family protein [Kitasatospora sp. NBC_00240]MCX5207719.1 SMI1/KNR4 family protein [Kitasatospora sp. NBC_00240]MCX5216057.1 SMI1/KNR4 family protein [Kitasatospora sp. NBC_00240]